MRSLPTRAVGRLGRFGIVGGAGMFGKLGFAGRFGIVSPSPDTVLVSDIV